MFSLSLINPSEQIYNGTELADKILKEKSSKHIQKIVRNEEFGQNPTICLINLMVNRGVGRCQSNDWARAFVISRIPHFADFVSSPDFLRSVAIKRFEGNTNKDKIMECFNKSIQSNLFQKHLAAGIKQFRDAINDENESAIFEAEEALRLPLTIFYQSEELNEYVYDEGYALE